MLVGTNSEDLWRVPADAFAGTFFGFGASCTPTLPAPVCDGYFRASMAIQYDHLHWRNGGLASHEIPPALDGYGLGDGVFETVAFRQNELEYWEEHMARLHAAARFFNLEGIPVGAELKLATELLLGAAPRGTDYRIRITAGRASHGSDVTIGFAPLPTVDAAPPKLVLSDVIRPAGNPSACFKTLAYTDHLAAQRDLAQGQEALLLNQWGRVACSAFANVYAHVEGVWVTPSVSEGALPGVIRGRVLAKAANVLGRENLGGELVVEGELELESLSGVQLLMSNSLRGVLRCRLEV